MIELFPALVPQALRTIGCFLYAVFVVSLFASKERIYHSQYFTFFYSAAFYAILNILSTVAPFTLGYTGLVEFVQADAFSWLNNIVMVLSGVTVIAYTFGKLIMFANWLLVIRNVDHVDFKVWSSRTTRVLLVGQLVVPIILQAYLESGLFTSYNTNGTVEMFNNQENASLHYVCGVIFGVYVLIALPIGLATLFSLRSVKKYYKNEIASMKISLAWYTIVCSATHGILAAHQIAWAIAYATDNQTIIAFCVSQYQWVADLTAFTCPVFMLFFSASVRRTFFRTVFCRPFIDKQKVNQTTAPPSQNITLVI